MTDKDFNKIYDLYIKCFPEYPVKRKLFFDLLELEKAVIIPAYEGGRLAGYSMIHGNSISLLCVDEEYRRKGIGSRLLEKSEEHIFNTGANKIILGRGSRYILQGVPDDNFSAVGFFKNKGYTAQWTSVNMSLDLADFSLNKLAIPPCPADVVFRFAKEGEKEAVLKAVDDAQAGWHCIFENCADPVFVAEWGGEIAGFEILSPQGGRFVPAGETVGCVGCVGVIHKARNKGIGMQMVAHGIEWLKAMGCTSIELRYVHLVDWYKKLGFKVIRHQWMGEKTRP